MGSVNGVRDGRIANNLDKEDLQKLIGELREKTLKEIGRSRLHYELAIAADKKRERCEQRLSELKYEPKRIDVG